MLAVSLFEDAVVVRFDGARYQTADNSAVSTAITLGLGLDWVLLLRLLELRGRMKLLARLLDREPSPAVRLAGLEHLGPGQVVAAHGRPPVAADLYRIGPRLHRNPPASAATLALDNRGWAECG